MLDTTASPPANLVDELLNHLEYRAGASAWRRKLARYREPGEAQPLRCRQAAERQDVRRHEHYVICTLTYDFFRETPEGCIWTSCTTLALRRLHHGWVPSFREEYSGTGEEA